MAQIFDRLTTPHNRIVDDGMMSDERLETNLRAQLARDLERGGFKQVDHTLYKFAKTKRLITGLKNGKDIGKYKGTALHDFIYVFSPTKHFFACTSGAHKGKLLVHDAECDSMFAEDATFDLVLMQRDCM